MWFLSPRSFLWGKLPHTHDDDMVSDKQIMSSLVPQSILEPHIKHARAKSPRYGNAHGYGFRRKKKAVAVGLSPVSVLAADSPLFFWMHRHWRAMIQFSTPTSGLPSAVLSTV